MYKVEEYTKDSDICFKYILSENDRQILADIIYDVLLKYKSPIQSIPYVKSCIDRIRHIYNSLDDFFNKNPGHYFLRLSTLSPKDAYYQLCVEMTDTNDEDITVDDIRKEINVLCVDRAEKCIQVLCHSLRVGIELRNVKTDLSILLLPWKDDILHDTETRCFIKNNKLIAFTQYYTDLSTGYESINMEINGEKYREVVIDFVNRLLIPYENAVVDVAVSSRYLNDGILDVDKMIFIEINPFNEDTESYLFTWDEILSINPETPIFRYQYTNSLIELL